jgi:hypothetical protein
MTLGALGLKYLEAQNTLAYFATDSDEEKSFIQQVNLKETRSQSTRKFRLNFVKIFLRLYQSNARP